MRRHLVAVAATAFFLKVSVPFAHCYPLPANVIRPLMRYQNSDDENSYKVWYEANAAKDYPRAVDLADAYLKKFPAGRYSEYLNKWISSLPILQIRFKKAAEAKDKEEMLRLGKRIIADSSIKEQDKFDYLWFMTVDLIQNELFAQPVNYSHVADIAAFTPQLLSLVKSGGRPTNVTGNWTQNSAISYLNQALGAIEENNKNSDRAAAYYEAAVSSDPTSVSASFACGRIHYNAYGMASEEFMKLSEADKVAVTDNKPEAKPGAKALHERVKKEADAVIDCWAKYLGSTMGVNNTTRSQVEEAVKDLYKYRHPESTESLQQIIDRFKRDNKTQP